MSITPLPTPPSRMSPSDFSTKADAFIAALPVFVTEANAQAAALELNSTTSNSTTSLAIGTGSKSLTVDVSKSYQPGMSVKIARTAAPSNWMHGDVTSYNAGTGVLVVNVLDVLGSGTFTDWTITFSAPISSGVESLRNLSFTATVAAKALTVALKGEDGNDPSATNSVLIKFRSATLTDGKPVSRTVTGALSVVLSSGSTLGFTAALAGRLYVWAIDNAGTVELALSRTADIFPESGLVSTTAEGGAGAADSATVMYSTTARSNLACRCIGYIEITTGGTAGEWDNAPTKIQIMGPGVKRTGDIVQRQGNVTGAYATGATTMPYDDTIPQITEGDEYMTQAITPTSAINKLVIDSIWFGSCSGPQILGVALFQDATAGALAAVNTYEPTSFYGGTVPLRHEMLAGTISATTFKVRAGSNGPGSTYFNGLPTSGRAYGGIAASSLTITEVFA